MFRFAYTCVAPIAASVTNIWTAQCECSNHKGQHKKYMKYLWCESTTNSSGAYTVSYNTNAQFLATLCFTGLESLAAELLVQADNKENINLYTAGPVWQESAGHWCIPPIKRD